MGSLLVKSGLNVIRGATTFFVLNVVVVVVIVVVILT